MNNYIANCPPLWRENKIPFHLMELISPNSRHFGEKESGKNSLSICFLKDLEVGEIINSITKIV